MRFALKICLAGCLGLATALLMSCGSGGAANLIPAGNAGPLKDDFAAVASAVAAGDCTTAKTAVQKAQSDLASLPASVDSALRAKLTNGVNNLASIAPVDCQNATTATTPTTATTVTTTPTTTTTTSTNTTPTQTTTTAPTTPTTPSTPTTTPTTPSNSGGAPAPGGAQAPSGSGGGGGSGGAGGTPGQ
jgi:hypothetical protein